ncbi:MAG: pinensin family lanthipeptide [Acidobacteriota bacterium]|nr:pinensin family lanthipeptide [Acidobacteriota bacterium]
MKSKPMKLNNLQVTSFVTKLPKVQSDAVVGGAAVHSSCIPPNCPCFNS